MNRSRWLLAPAVVLAGSQVGHLITYQARFGPHALREQSQSAHGYFPYLASSAGAVAGAALVAALLVIAGARLRGARRRGLLARPGLPWLDLLALVFTLQLAAYFAQETLESLLSGATAVPAPDLILWGALGQLPVAAAGALALGWLSIRFEAAMLELDGAAGPGPLQPHPLVPTSIPGWAYRGEPLRASAPAVFIKRGPPQTSV